MTGSDRYVDIFINMKLITSHVVHKTTPGLQGHVRHVSKGMFPCYIQRITDATLSLLSTETRTTMVVCFVLLFVLCKMGRQVQGFKFLIYLM